MAALPVLRRRELPGAPDHPPSRLSPDTRHRLEREVRTRGAVSSYGWPTRKAKRNRARHYWRIINRRAARGEYVKSRDGVNR